MNAPTKSGSHAELVDSDSEGDDGVPGVSKAKAPRPPRRVGAGSCSVAVRWSTRWVFEGISITLVVSSMLLSTLLTDPWFEELVQNTPEGPRAVFVAELCFGFAFVIEYCVRLVFNYRDRGLVGVFAYAFSLAGCIDATAGFSIISDIHGMDHSRKSFHWLWMLRLFRVLKFMRYLNDMNTIATAVAAEKKALAVFMIYVFLLCFLFGTVLFYLEDADDGFYSIPASIWCVIVTVTTVGYGETVPQSTLGRFLICFCMLLGYSTLAVPTIVGVMDVFTSSHKKGERHPKRKAETGSLQQVETPGGAVLEVANSQTLPCAYFSRVRLRPWECDADGFPLAATYSQLCETAVLDLYASEAGWTLGRGEPSRPVAVQSSCKVLSLAPATEGHAVVGLSVVGMTDCSCAFRASFFSEEGGPLRAEGTIEHRWIRSAIGVPEHGSPAIPSEVASALGRMLKGTSACLD